MNQTLAIMRCANMTSTIKVYAEATYASPTAIRGVAGVVMTLYKGGDVVETLTTTDSGVARFAATIKAGAMGQYSVKADVQGIATRYAFSGSPSQNVETGNLFQKTGRAYVHKVSFSLTPLTARLRARFVYQSHPERLFKAASVTVKCLAGDGLTPVQSRASAAGRVDVGEVAPGAYKLTAELSAPDDCRFGLVSATTDVTLQRADDTTVVFEVLPLYQSVQFIAHCLLTIPKQVFFEDVIEVIPAHVIDVKVTVYNKTGKRRVPEQRVVKEKEHWKARYNGFVSDEEDVTARVALVTETILHARTYASDDPTVLKVFAIPECYFQGKYGAYTTRDVFCLLDLLQDAVKAQMWKDWIFVFGTVNGTEVGAGDMYNVSPVFRGGHGSGDKGPYRRLLQKVYFSAELIGESSLLAETGLQRAPLVSENVVFQPTEHEVVTGGVVQSFLASPGGDAPIAVRLRNEIMASGQTAVVRRIRVGDDLEARAALERHVDWMTSQAAPPLPVVGAGVAVALHVLPAVPAPKPHQGVKLTAMLLDRAGQRAVAARDVLVEVDVRTPGGEVVTLAATIARGESHQETPMYMPAGGGRHDVEARGLGLAQPLMHRTSFFVFERALITQRGEDFDYRDYCFTCARMPGPWLDWTEAAQQKPCQKLTFGLEICADHNKERLAKSLKTAREGAVPALDIQLIPSAGMYPNGANVVVRSGGYTFNCDGWNHPSAQGMKKVENKVGNFLEVTLKGNPMFPFNPNPLYPHSVVFKGAGVESEIIAMAAAATRVPLLGVLDNRLTDVLFGEGPGELHVYPPHPLPH